MPDEPTDLEQPQPGDESLDNLLNTDDEPGDDTPPSPSDEPTAGDPPPAPPTDEPPTPPTPPGPERTVPLSVLQAERKKRQDAERERDEALGVTPPRSNAVRPKPSTPVYDQFQRNRFITEVHEAERTDPTVRARMAEIEQIMFEEMPELLDKPTGFQTANEISRGRSVSPRVETRPDAPVPPQTTPARPRTTPQAPKKLSQAEINKMTPDELAAYEDAQMKAHASNR